MLDMYYRWYLKNRLFALDAEEAHEKVLQKLRWLERHPWLCKLVRSMYDRSNTLTQVTAMGLTFPNPVGLAAGLDKNCVVPHALAALGFGSLELGGVTPWMQPGNDRPRMWRDVERRELLNTLGFPSDGKDIVQARCRAAHPFPIPVGCNLGKDKYTSLKKTAADMCLTMTTLYRYFDWFTINVSSPNTKGLQELQAAEFLDPLLRHVLEYANFLMRYHHFAKRKKIVVKFSPDLSNEALVDAVGCCLEAGIDGVILGNTRRAMMPNSKIGGKSGPALYDRTIEMVRRIAPQVRGRCALIACGGIYAAGQVEWLLREGADLVQIFTTLIFEGPGQPSRLVHGITPYLTWRRTKETVAA